MLYSWLWLQVCVSCFRTRCARHISYYNIFKSIFVWLKLPSLNSLLLDICTHRFLRPLWLIGTIVSMLFANQNSPKGELVISNVKMTNWSPRRIRRVQLFRNQRYEERIGHNFWILHYNYLKFTKMFQLNITCS